MIAKKITLEESRSMRIKAGVSLLLILLFVGGSAKTLSWQTIKNHIRSDVQSSVNPTTLYAGCTILPNWTIDIQNCGVTFRKPLSNRIDIEHAVTSQRMREHAGCGKLSRTECRKTNAKFKACHNDKDNLFPAISTINRYRGSLPFRELEKSNSFAPFGKATAFRKAIDGKSVEPPERAKHLVATAYLTMDAKDCISLSDDEFFMFLEWVFDK